LAKANFKAKVLLLCGEGEYVIDDHRGWGALGEDKLDLLWCLVFRIKDNHIVEAINFEVLKEKGQSIPASKAVKTLDAPAVAVTL
jgi:hypothetical protein